MKAEPKEEGVYETEIRKVRTEEVEGELFSSVRDALRMACGILCGDRGVWERPFLEAIEIPGAIKYEGLTFAPAFDLAEFVATCTELPNFAEACESILDAAEEIKQREAISQKSRELVLRARKAKEEMPRLRDKSLDELAIPSPTASIDNQQRNL
ncbi:gp18 [Corynebacterium phage P1201]|uniref:Gp18 n=1 Tax=Corynebacterium phage P1201 TaxID=384848 RepID=A7IY89_9CAUD|nr:gp18 [Corynebacterium phage P1201]ABF57472.1 gp18 [Corynebacterium phage P1201]